jgi:hypothetical protein
MEEQVQYGGFKKAVKYEAKLRMAIAGPSGSGKTYTALKMATVLAQGKPVAVVDTEHGSASKYADLFTFDVMEPAEFSPQTFIDAIRQAEKAGYVVIVLDSLSHAWAGTGGLLDIVDNIAKRSKSTNSFAAWKDATPLQNQLIDTIIGCGIHVIATMRSKQGYVMEANEYGKQSPKKVGMEPVQRDGVEYEFDVFAEMDVDNNMVITKSRCPAISGAIFKKPDIEPAATLLAWLSGKPTAGRKPAASASTTPQGVRAPLAPDKLQARIVATVAKHPNSNVKPTDGQRGMMVGRLGDMIVGDADAKEQGRHLFLEYVFGTPTSKELTVGQVTAILDWINSGADVAAVELADVITTQMRAKGQLGFDAEKAA